MISVMLVDDQQAILSGLAELIESTGIAKVVAAETDGEAAISSALSLYPDLIMVDVSIPEMSGIDIAKKLVEKWQDVRILAVSAHANSIYVRSMLNAGAQGYMLKDNASSEIKNAMRTVMSGGTWIGEGLSPGLA